MLPLSLNEDKLKIANHQGILNYFYSAVCKSYVRKMRIETEDFCFVQKVAVKSHYYSHVLKFDAANIQGRSLYKGSVYYTEAPN